MLERTDKHFRFFLRLISRRVLLYTEMVTVGAILRGNRRDILAYDPAEHPLAIQVGGSDPAHLAECAKIAEDYGYDAINLNVGCPSKRVQKGRFGACLMSEPDLVAECVQAMYSSVEIPITLKTRIGIDGRDSYNDLSSFVAKVASAGCSEFIIHARKAILGGLTPRQNRSIPPLNYDRVRRLKKEFPVLPIVLNGGITRLDEIAEHLSEFDGVMIGREAYSNPYLLVHVDQLFYGDETPRLSRGEVLRRYLPYVQSQLESGIRLSSITRHLCGLFHGVSGARNWRRSISEISKRPQADVYALVEALDNQQ